MFTFAGMLMMCAFMVFFMMNNYSKAKLGPFQRGGVLKYKGYYFAFDFYFVFVGALLSATAGVLSWLYIQKEPDQTPFPVFVDPNEANMQSGSAYPVYLRSLSSRRAPAQKSSADELLYRSFFGPPIQSRPVVDQWKTPTEKVFPSQKKTNYVVQSLSAPDTALPDQNRSRNVYPKTAGWIKLLSKKSQISSAKQPTPYKETLETGTTGSVRKSTYSYTNVAGAGVPTLTLPVGAHSTKSATRDTDQSRGISGSTYSFRDQFDGRDSSQSTFNSK